MAPLLRFGLLLLPGIFLPAFLLAQPIATPAFVDAVAFDFHADGESHKVVVTAGPTLVRVDMPEDGYSILYNPQTEYYIGLEHRNYTYWEFSWPEVRASVENSKRYESHLQELGNQGLTADSVTPSSNAPTESSTSAGSDDSGYVWHPTADRKRIVGLDCIRWTGDTVSGESVEAWCYNGPLPKIRDAVDRLRKINEPMALVPVRTVVPDFIFPVYDALTRGGVTPLLIDWGADKNKNSFRFEEAKSREDKAALFIVPRLYVKTTLVTMDGMLNQQPAEPARKSVPAKTWQN